MSGFRRYECFVAVAQTLHFRKAAEQVAMTQPALSQQIAALEKSLGVKLFDRDRRKVSLTQAGKVLLPAARDALMQLEKAQAEIKRLAAQDDTLLRIAFLEYLKVPHLSQVLGDLRQKHPEIDVRMSELHSDAVLHALVARDIEVGVGFLPPDHPDLAGRETMSGVWMAAIPEDHALSQFDELPLDRLAGDSVITFARHLNSPLYDKVLRLMQSAHPEARIAYHVSQPSTGPEYVRDGLGCFLHASYVLPDLPPGVTRRPVSGFDPISIGLMWRSDRKTKAVRAFLEAHKREIAKNG
ncbi:LysR family transcriptional regulator [Roseobacter sp. MH60115]|uniref:LysR family transcriptional regulator n=1 Tax=Roseobacter sp. MH60115 TaxID=2785324 RepID=UPI0018A2ABCA|nr:LysR family transcriptional regulator [Roseobacter sp. MH60115]